MRPRECNTFVPGHNSLCCVSFPSNTSTNEKKCQYLLCTGFPPARERINITKLPRRVTQRERERRERREIERAPKLACFSDFSNQFRACVQIGFWQLHRLPDCTVGTDWDRCEALSNAPTISGLHSAAAAAAEPPAIAQYLRSEIISRTHIRCDCVCFVSGVCVCV